jgi:hypothetical protein
MERVDGMSGQELLDKTLALQMSDGKSRLNFLSFAGTCKATGGFY